jgi:hypothetical protein
MSLQRFLAAPPLAAVVSLLHDRDNNNEYRAKSCGTF